MLSASASNISLAIILLICSYLIGAIPFGVLFGKLICGKDIRKYGSKNIGTTNTIRVLGKKVGFTVFFFDVLKGALMIIIIKYILEPFNIWQSPIPHLSYGLAAIIGHTFSIYLDFKGGKGVATSLGVVLALTPIPAVLCLICFVIVLYSTGYVSLASTGATLTVLISAWILHFVGISSENVSFLGWLIGKPDIFTEICYSLMGVLILLKHIKNYKRLMAGTENSFKKRGCKKT